MCHYSMFSDSDGSNDLYVYDYELQLDCDIYKLKRKVNAYETLS